MLWSFKILFFYTFLCHFKLCLTKEASELCLLKVENIELDLNKLKTNGYEVKHKDERLFLLNICGAAPHCGENVSVCELDTKTKNVKHILGYLDTLTILNSYKPIPGLKYQTSGRKKSRVEIEFKCNRHSKNNKVIYVPPTGVVGRKYKFVFESNFVCFQRNMNCEVRNIHDNLQYNLNSLNKRNENWVVENTTQDLKIFLNLCGGLNQINGEKNQECLTSGTQVCLVKKGNSKNLGLVSSDFETNEDSISILFKDGSSCAKNKYIETKIDLICSFHEENPVLFDSSTCNYHITWRTKAACPNYVFLGKTCQIYDTFYGSRNFASLFTNDSEKLISNHLVRYNLCDSLFIPCGLHNNASICANLNGEHISYGWMHASVISKNRKITMDLVGEICHSNIFRSTHINFYCDKQNARINKISFSRDMCRLDIDIYTDLACPQEHTANCTIQENNIEYNLHPLSLETSNYEVQDIYNSNIIYVINICKPVVYSDTVFCDLYSSICVRNNSEPNINKKFKSLGTVSSFSLVVRNENVIMQYNNGGICATLAQPSILTEIEFICDKSAQQSYPVFTYKDDCNFKFVWRNRYTCGTRK